MTSPEAPVTRTRNAAATRAAILDAARVRFSKEGYDGASLRDIAGEVGVDVALVSRYFGSKDELFNQVLVCEGPDDLFKGERSDFGERVARMLVEDDRDDEGMETLLMILRSASSTKAAGMIRASSQREFYGPIEDIVGGPDRVLRARMIGALITGFCIMRAIDEDFLLGDDSQLGDLGARLAGLVQAIADAPCKKD